MIPFTPGELALNRAAFTADLPDACTVQRYGLTADNSGDFTEAWTPDGAAVACRVAPLALSATEQPVAGRTGLVQVYAVTLAQGSAVAAADRISWDTGGKVLQVVGPGGRSREYSRRIRAVEVT